MVVISCGDDSSGGDVNDGSDRDGSDRSGGDGSSGDGGHNSSEGSGTFLGVSCRDSVVVMGTSLAWLRWNDLSACKNSTTVL